VASSPFDEGAAVAGGDDLATPVGVDAAVIEVGFVGIIFRFSSSLILSLPLLFLLGLPREY
jgi:hypothetical protein